MDISKAFQGLKPMNFVEIFAMPTSQEEMYMQECLDLALQASAFVAPNPMVGCLIVKDGDIVAKGYHRALGQAHAEVMAVEALPADIDTKDCSLYVNLEPCAHHGKTPPCVELLIAKKFKEVVIGSLDPNPLVAGKGIAKLRTAGIVVKLNVLQEKCEFMNRKFYFYHQKKLPYITLKWAETKDGFIGRHTADLHASKQVSSDASKNFVHQLRADHMALMIGARTANLDNPLLTVRHVDGNDPLKIIVSRNNTVEPSLQLLKQGQTWIFNTLMESVQDELSYIKLKRHTFLEDMLDTLYREGIQSVLLEGGSQLAQSMIDHGYWNECYRITSNIEWNKGVPAPRIELSPKEEYHLGEDRIQRYFNK